jgi:hypothetical protein
MSYYSVRRHLFPASFFDCTEVSVLYTGRCAQNTADGYPEAEVFTQSTIEREYAFPLIGSSTRLCRAAHQFLVTAISVTHLR